MRWPWQRVSETDPAHVAASTNALNRVDAIADRIEDLLDDLRQVVAEERGDRP